MRRIAFRGGSNAFSLTEIAIAVGVVAFGMIAVVGLLPTGLTALRSGRDELAGAHCLRALCDGLRGAERMTTNLPAVYRARGALTNLEWTAGQTSPVAVILTNLTASGLPASRPEDTQLNARIELRAPEDPRTAGSAFVSVAWPATATWGSSNWQNCQGQISTHLVFVPQ